MHSCIDDKKCLCSFYLPSYCLSDWSMTTYECGIIQERPPQQQQPPGSHVPCFIRYTQKV